MSIDQNIFEGERPIQRVGSVETDIFVINDVILQISPTQISIDKQAFNHEWQTLRTRTSQKVKSGHSISRVSLDITFKGSDITHKLIPLIAGLRATPFAAVYNEYLKDMLFQQESGDQSFNINLDLTGFKSIVLVLSSGSITTLGHQGMPDCIGVQLDFLWFNYFPYTPIWAYKGGPGSNRPSYPWKSDLWKAFYKPFKGIGVNWPYQGDTIPTVFKWREYSSVASGDTLALEAVVNLIQILQKEPKQFIQQARSLLDKEGAISPKESLIDALYKSLSRDVTNNPGDWTGVEINQRVRKAIQDNKGTNIGGAGTGNIDPILQRVLQKSYKKGVSTAAEDVNSVEKENIISTIATLKKRIRSLKQADREGFSPEDNKDETKSPWVAIQSTENKYGERDRSVTGGAFTLLSRRKQLSIGENNKGTKTSSTAESVVIEQVSITFSNILALIPMIGYRYPTCQHIGSMDADVTFVINATNKDAGKINQMYDTIESMALHFRMIPAGFLNLAIDNDFLMLFGIREFITKNLSTDSIPGQPGRSRVVLTLSEAGITSKTKLEDAPEKIEQEYVRADKSLNEGIWDIIKNKSHIYGPQFNEREMIKVTDFKAYERWPNIAKKKTDKALFDIIMVACKTYNEFVKKVHSILFSRGSFESIGFAYVVLESLKGDGEYPFIPGLDDLIKGVNKRADRMVDEGLKKGINKLVKDIGPPSKGKNSMKAKANQVLAQQKYADAETAKTSKDKLIGEIAKRKKMLDDMGLSEYLRKMSVLFSSVDLTLLEFEHLYNQHKKLGLNKGLMAYPDFKQQLRSVAEVLGNNISDESLTMLNPDIYMWYPMDYGLASTTGVIGEEVIRAAEILSLDSYNSLQEAVPAFFEGKYKGFLSRNNVKGPKEKLGILGKGWSPGLSVIGNSKYDCSLRSEGSGEGIKKQYISDAYEKSHFNLPSMNTLMTCSNSCFHTLDPRDLWGTVPSGAGSSPDTTKGAPNGLNNHGSQRTTELGTNRAGKRKGIEVYKVNWGQKQPADQSLQDPNTKYYCPIESWSYIATNGCLAMRDIGCGSKMAFTDYRRQNAIIDWDAGKVANDAGWANPHKEADRIGKPVTKWTYEEYWKAKAEAGRAKKLSQGEKTDVSWARHTHIRNYIGYRHKGLDVMCNVGTNIYAIADGKVLESSYYNGAGYSVGILHNSGPVQYSRYLHLQEISPKAKKGATVRAGQCIAIAGRSGQDKMSPHLHFETWARKRQGKDAGSLLNPLEVINWKGRTFGGIKRYDPKNLPMTKQDKVQNEHLSTDINPDRISPMIKAIRAFEHDMLNGQAQTLLRAYPTFKLYFIEDDRGERKRLAFDDFFSYNAVKSIRVIRSRKIAADLCELYLTNVSGVLSNRKFSQKYGSGQPRDSKGNITTESRNPMNADTVQENPIASLLLQEGISISLRLGYNSDPDQLTTVFNGVITEIEFTESEDLVRIIAQSYAIELVQDIKGIEKSGVLSDWNPAGITFWGICQTASTAKILEEMISQPEVIHFGRWEKPGDSKTFARDLLTSKWQFVANPADDNIFAPPAKKEAKTLSDGLVFKDMSYVIYRTTVWDIFKEMEMRHPNFIASAVPYKDLSGERMTMFFGLPNQLYFSRHPNLEEARADKKLIQIQEEIKKKYDKLPVRSNYTKPEQLEEILKNAKKKGLKISGYDIPQMQVEGFVIEGMGDFRRAYKSIRDKGLNNQYLSKAEVIRTEDILARQIKDARLKGAVDAGFIGPFRQYHLITSGQHIISNDIRANSRDVANTIVIKYKDDITDINEAPGGGSIATLGDENTFTLKLDNALPTEEIRTQVGEFINANSEELAKRYALTLLAQNMKDVYKGDITIIGNPTIKPYDICLSGDTLISTQFGLKPISKIKIGDIVYTHLGNLQSVSQLFRRECKEVFYKVKCKTDPEVLNITGNHPVLSLKREEIYNDSKPWIGRKQEGYNPQFRKVSDLQAKDFIAIPRLYNDNNLHPSFAKLLGYYLAEGAVVWEQRKTNNKERSLNKKQPASLPKKHRVPVAIQWSFDGIKKFWILDEINSLLGNLGFQKKAKEYRDPRSNGISIIFYDRDFTEQVISSAGYNTKEDNEGKWLRNWYNIETSKIILGAYFNGDGSSYSSIRQGSLCSGGTSLNLGRNIRQLAINCGIPCSSSICKNVSKWGKEGSLVYSVNISRFYSNQLVPYTWYPKAINVKKNTNCSCLIDSNYVYLPISSLEIQESPDFVYNIGVQGDNSYIATNKAVHNCYIFDEYTDMVGPIEVEQVSHVFDQEYGFRTEIKPDMVVQAAEWSLLTSCEAMGMIMEGWMGMNVKGSKANFFAPFARAVGAGIAEFGGFLSKKILNFTQLAQPIVMSPLMLHGRIFAGGVPTRKIPTSVWETMFGNWSNTAEGGFNDWWEDTTDAWINTISKWRGKHSEGNLRKFLQDF